MYSGVNIANQVLKEKAGRFLRREWGHMCNMLKKFFPEHVESLPSPGEAFNCTETDVFQHIQMNLICVYGYLISKLD